MAKTTSLIKYFFLSLLFNIIFSSDDSSLDLVDNFIGTLTLNIPKTLIITNPEGKTIYFFLKPKDKLNITTNIEGVGQTIEINNYWSISKVKHKYIEINITSTNENSTEIDVINIIRNEENDDYKYEVLEKANDKKIITKKNFVLFFDKEKINSLKNEAKISLEIQFHFENNNANFAYGIVGIPTNDTNYLPRAFNFDYNISNCNLTKENKYYVNKTNKYKNTTFTNAESLKNYVNEEYIAFVFSIDIKDDDIAYSVVIKIDNGDYNWVLIISIILATIFAFSTFFLIRKKEAYKATTLFTESNLSEDLE